MDVLSVTILQELKKIDLFKDAVIAGGACRDYLMGGTLSDVDVFLPVKNQNQFFDIYYSNDVFDKLIKNFVVVGQAGFERYGVKGRAKIDLLYKDKVAVDLVIVDYHGERFADDLLETFDYSINQMYYDDKKNDVVITQAAQRDMQNRQATLIRCESPQDMYRSVMRFEKWRQKYPDLRFNTTLEFKDREDRKQQSKENPCNEIPLVAREVRGEWVVGAAGQMFPG